LRNAPQKVADLIYKFYADKGYTMSLDAFSKALSRVEVNPGFPRDLEPYMQQQAGTCSRTRRSNAIPDWKTALRPDFMERARAAS
jgi:NitT/TauT family transport system substrate-binding protein